MFLVFSKLSSRNAKQMFYGIDLFFGHCLSVPHNYGNSSQEVKTISAANVDAYILFCKIYVILFLFCFFVTI